VDKRWEEAYTTVGYVLGINLVRYFVMYLQDSQHIKYIENGVNTFLQNYSLKTILKLNPAQYLEDNSAIKLIVISRGEESIKQIIYILLFELLPTISLVIFATMAVSIYSLTISMYTIATFTVATIWTFLFARYHQKFIKQNIDNWDTRGVGNMNNRNNNINNNNNNNNNSNNANNNKKYGNGSRGKH
jgi:ABC-type transport system involved in Fe-S cluster assembly fused permease/ATPase subunit